MELLEQEVTTLKLAAETRAKTALIEDYFFVNEEELQIMSDTGFILVNPFCIEGPGVIDFNLAASFTISVAAVRVDLMVGGLTVATSSIDDDDAPSNLALSYRGKIEEDANAMVVVMAAGATNIEPKHL